LWQHSRSKEEQAQLKEVKSNKKYFGSINMLSRRWNQVYILSRIRAYQIYSHKSITTIIHQNPRPYQTIVAWKFLTSSDS
jgi:hypothetical protein